MGVQLVSVSAFGTEVPPRNGGLRIALNGNELAISVISELPAPDATIRADRSRDLGFLCLGKQAASVLAHGLGTRAVGAGFYLLNKRPAREKFLEQEGLQNSTRLRENIAGLGCGNWSGGRLKFGGGSLESGVSSEMEGCAIRNKTLAQAELERGTLRIFGSAGTEAVARHA